MSPPRILVLCCCIMVSNAATFELFPWRLLPHRSVTAYDAKTTTSSEMTCVRECMKRSQCDSCAFDRESGTCYLQVQTDSAAGITEGSPVVYKEGSLCHESEAPINHAITDVSWRKTSLEMEGEQRCNDDSIFIGNSPTVRCFHTGVWLSEGICRQRIWRNIPHVIRLHMPTVTKPAPGWTVCYNGTAIANHPLRASINYLNDNDDVVVHLNTRLNDTYSNGTYTDKFTLSERLNGGWTNTVSVLGLNPFPIRLNQLFSMTIKAVSLHEVQFYVDGTLYGRYTTTVSLDTVTNVQPWGQGHVDVINLLCDV